MAEGRICVERIDEPFWAENATDVGVGSGVVPAVVLMLVCCGNDVVVGMFFLLHEVQMQSQYFRSQACFPQRNRNRKFLCAFSTATPRRYARIHACISMW